MKKLRIGVLTSSRADYGIYTPLLNELEKDDRFETTLIVFGMHLEDRFGLTVSEVERDNLGKVIKVTGLSGNDSPEGISRAYGECILSFIPLWETEHFDYVLALGDRFEMSAAVQSGIPFGVNFIHLFGGETTLGAIDNIYRHQITHASKIHFTSTEQFASRVKAMTGQDEGIYNVGSISLENITELDLPLWNRVASQFNIPLKPFILVTFHPETVHNEKNDVFSKEAAAALKELSNEYHIVITMTNADANGRYYTQQFEALKAALPERVSLVDSFGRVNYFAAMSNCAFLLGNTSSGIVEAASFKKYVINVGDRQKGRLQSENIINADFVEKEIVNAAQKAAESGEYTGSNIYYKPGSTSVIIDKIVNANI